MAGGSCAQAGRLKIGRNGMAFQARGEIREGEVPDNDRRKTRRLHGRDAGLQAANRKAAVFHAVLIAAVVHVMQGAGGLRLVHCGF